MKGLKGFTEKNIPLTIKFLDAISNLEEITETNEKERKIEQLHQIHSFFKLVHLKDLFKPFVTYFFLKLRKITRYPLKFMKKSQIH